ncbi:MAG TPA: DUF6064 family protein [Methanotrichaceae archaeon]|nr:DUF6064 family protein [Methanotrichaceae archaeon]
MDLPFTVEQFFNIFQAYNTAIWPAQIIAYLIGIGAVALAFRENKLSGRIISGILALFWIWMGVFYHMAYFSAINSAAMIFGALFVIEGLLFIVVGSIWGRLSFRFDLKPVPIVGAIFILYAMVVYPLAGLALGHWYPRAPMFGVAPCPTTIFTFGLLLWAKKLVSAYILVIPLIWSIIGTMAAVGLQVPQDYGLGIAGIVGTILVIMRNRDLRSDHI